MMLGGIHNPREKIKGKVSQMTKLLNEHYLAKLSKKGEAGQKYPIICPRGLWMAPLGNRVTTLPYTSVNTYYCSIKNYFYMHMIDMSISA